MTIFVGGRQPPMLVDMAAVRWRTRLSVTTPEKETEQSNRLATVFHTRVSGHQDPGANIITRCAGTKSHTYDESWHRIECHIFTI
jgi:hypothetical protein